MVSGITEKPTEGEWIQKGVSANSQAASSSNMGVS